MPVLHQTNASLSAFNTLAIPSSAACLVRVESVAELTHILREKRQQFAHILLLGSGSNLVLPDFFDGLVIHIALKERVIEQESDTSVTVSLAAGENWHDVVMWAANNNWYGIENLALIPGTVGAAPVQNIGAYGVEIKDVFFYLEAIHLQTGELKRFSQSDCQFSYRESIFKQAQKNQWVIIRVVLTLSKTPKVCIDYPALASTLSSHNKEELTASDIANAVIDIRRSKLPDPEHIPNAGSFFKNPIISKAHFELLQQSYPDIVSYPVGDEQIKIAAGWLLDKDGWKGRFVDGIAMHQQQALVLTNPNKCSQKQILAFANKVQHSIKARFDIDLEIEPMVIDNGESNSSQAKA